jgi:hypothetical protein
VSPDFFRLRETVQLLGWRLAWVGPLWAVRPRYLVLTRSLDGPLPPVPPRPDLRCSTLTEADVPSLTAVDPGLDIAEIRRRLDEGQACHLYWIGESLAHYRWEATRLAYLPYLGLTLRLLPGDMCSTWTFTAPAFRGAGLMTVTSPASLHRMHAQGARRAVSVVAWWNTPSMRVTRQTAGRAVVGAVGCWRIGRWRRYFAEGAVRLDGHRAFHIAGA